MYKFLVLACVGILVSESVCSATVWKCTINLNEFAGLQQCLLINSSIIAICWANCELHAYFISVIH